MFPEFWLSRGAETEAAGLLIRRECFQISSLAFSRTS